MSFTESPSVPVPSGVKAYFDRDVQRVFDKSCVGGCHEPGGSGERLTGLNLKIAVSYTV